MAYGLNKPKVSRKSASVEQQGVSRRFRFELWLHAEWSIQALELVCSSTGEKARQWDSVLLSVFRARIKHSSRDVGDLKLVVRQRQFFTCTIQDQSES